MPRASAWARVGERINAGFTENAFSYLLFLRLVPAFPFFLVNLAPAFTAIPLRTYVLATLIGIIPGTFVYVNLGQTLGRIESLQGLVSRETLLAFGLLGLFALLPVAWKRLKSRRTEKRTNDGALRWHARDHVVLLAIGRAAERATSRTAPFDALLRANVKSGHVDYRGIPGQPPDLKAYLAELAKPAKLDSKTEQLAYNINAYNAFAIQGILDGLSPSSFLGRQRYFKLQEWPLAGKRISLHDLEHVVLRPLGDPAHALRDHLRLEVLPVPAQRSLYSGEARRAARRRRRASS